MHSESVIPSAILPDTSSPAIKENSQSLGLLFTFSISLTAKGEYRDPTTGSGLPWRRET